MNFLIYGAHLDYHTDSVAWVLRQNGHHVDVWYQGNFPNQQNISIYFNSKNKCKNWIIEDFSFEIKNLVKYDLIWYRRPSTAILADYVNDADKEMAIKEANSLMQGMDYLLKSDVRWVNSPESNRKASNKVLQLDTAVLCGLTIPNTLVSNCPSRIRDFVASCNAAIYKPFFQAGWLKERIGKSIVTTKIDLSLLSNDKSLAACPGIFQEFIEKDFEVRLTIMGNSWKAVKIGNYKNDASAIDWRTWANTDAISYSTIDLPNLIIEQCLKLTEILQIRFACIDLICGKDGNYYFLEANPGGQFLWLESAVPETRILESFCNFLLAEVGVGTAVRPVTMLDYDVACEGKKTVLPHTLVKNSFAYSDV